MIKYKELSNIDQIKKESELQDWNYSLIEQIDEDLKDDAKAHFGTTDYWKTCFYINTDGTMLDGSGKKFGASGGSRKLDHRDVSAIMPDGIEGTDAMLKYMSEGNIRFQPEARNFEIMKKPTYEQYEIMERLINHFYDEVHIDIVRENGDTIESFFHDFDEPANKILAQVKKYFINNEDFEPDAAEVDAENIYYHGSPDANIIRFECHENDRPTAFFTKSKKYAAEYTYDLDTGEQTGCIYKVKLHFDSPFDVDGPEGIAFKNEFYIKNTVMMTDIVYKYLQAHYGVYDNKKYDCIISREDLSPKMLAEYGKEANINYVPLESEQIEIVDKIFAQASLHEDTRNQLIAKSRSTGQYKNTTRGKNRFERKKYSKVVQQVKSFNSIDMNKFFKQDILEVNVPVVGETNTYDVTIKLEGVVEEIQRNIKANHNMLEYRTIVQALTKVFNTTNVYVKCTCDDFKYRFKHFSIINQWGADDSAHDPGPGKGIANPQNDKGNGCKHILLVLANTDWIMKVASVINNYINYAEKNMKKAFLSIIFPKLYGIPASAATEEELVPEDTNLETTKDIIALVNDFGRNRGKYQKGSNKNPVTNSGGKPAKQVSQEQNEPEDTK